MPFHGPGFENLRLASKQVESLFPFPLNTSAGLKAYYSKRLESRTLTSIRGKEMESFKHEKNCPGVWPTSSTVFFLRNGATGMRGKISLAQNPKSKGNALPVWATENGDHQQKLTQKSALLDMIQTR